MSVGSATNPFNPHLGVLNSSQKEGEGEREASTAVSVSSEGQPEGQAQVEGLGGINLNLLAIQSGIDLGPMGHHREGSGDSQRSESSASFTRKDSDSDALTGRKDSDASTTSTSSTSSKSSHVSSADLPMTNEVKGHEKAQELLKPFAAELKGKEHWSLECFILHKVFDKLLLASGLSLDHPDDSKFQKFSPIITRNMSNYIKYFFGKISLKEVVQYPNDKGIKGLKELIELADDSTLHQSTVREILSGTPKASHTSTENYEIIKEVISFIEQFLKVNLDIAKRSHNKDTSTKITKDGFYPELIKRIEEFKVKITPIVEKLKALSSEQILYPRQEVLELIKHVVSLVNNYNDDPGNNPVPGSPDKEAMKEINLRLLLPIASASVFNFLKKYDDKYNLDLKNKDYAPLPIVKTSHRMNECGLI